MQALARTGVGRFAIADIDEFEVSNFNRQVFADLDSVGRGKAEATAARLRRIHPDVALEVYGNDWQQSLDDLLQRYRVVVNGMDDIAAGIDLYRRARVSGATVIDAYASPLAVGLRRRARGSATRGAAGLSVRRPPAGQPRCGAEERVLREGDRARPGALELDPVHRHGRRRRARDRQAQAHVVCSDGDHDGQSHGLRGGQAASRSYAQRRIAAATSSTRGR